MRVVGIPLAMLANIVLARSLSVSDFGVFAFTISLVTVLAIPVNGGLPVLLTREVAGYASTGNWPAYKGLVFAAHKWVIVIAIIVGICLLGWWLVIGRTQTQPLLFAIVILPFLGFNGIRSGILKGLGQPILSETPVSLIQPALLLVGYLGLAGLGLLTLANSLWWYVVVSLGVCLIGVIFLLRVQPAEVGRISLDTTDRQRWQKAMLPLTMLSAATTFTAQIAILLLGALGDSESVAHMSVAQRAAQLVVLPLMVMNSVVAPNFVNALQSGARDQLRSVAQYSARLTFAVALPVATIFALFGRPILGLTFGPDYGVSAYMPMLILVMAQLLSAAVGASGYLLTISGHERLSLVGQVLGVIALAAITIVLAPEYGAVGAACGAAAGILIPKFANALFVWNRLGIRTGIV